MTEKLTITIFDAEGKIVTQDNVECQTASVEEVDEMVSLINNGTPAWLACQLVKPRES